MRIPLELDLAFGFFTTLIMRIENIKNNQQLLKYQKLKFLIKLDVVFVAIIFFILKYKYVSINYNKTKTSN